MLWKAWKTLHFRLGYQFKDSVYFDRVISRARQANVMPSCVEVRWEKRETGLPSKLRLGYLLSAFFLLFFFIFCLNLFSVLSDMDETSYRSVNDPNGNAHPFWSDSPNLNLEEVECFRRKLKYFFMNPCEKYRARGRKPWKLILQIIKVAIITIQVSTNANISLTQSLLV